MRLSMLAVLAVLATVPAHADPVLEAVSAQVILSGSNGSSTIYNGLSPSPNPKTYTLSSGAGGVSNGGNQSGSDPAVTSSVQSGGLAGGQSLQSSSYTWYEFDVNGPANQTIGVTITGSGQESVSNLTGNLSSSASLSVVLPENQATPDDGYAAATLLNDFACSCTSPAVASSGFNVDQVFDVQTGTAYVVELYTDTYFSGATGGSAQASVDPTITLDTSDPAYSLEFSPGLGALSPTPEPSSLALLGTGLAGVFLLARRSSRFA